MGPARDLGVAEGPVGFRGLQTRCDRMSPSVLSARLAELREAGVVGKGAEENYSLTEEGRRLLEALDPLSG
jgi:DNA-binding HxlR family transcriptional regulator